MISGVVTANYEATIPLVVRGVHGQESPIDAIMDTGFTGALTLPSALIATLGLPWLGRQRVMLGDGSVRFFNVYTATILWDGQPRSVEVDEADPDPLLGMSLLAGHEVRMQIVNGGAVIIEALP